MALLTNRVTEGILTFGSIGTLLGGMSMVDDTFRGHLAGLVTGERSSALALAGVHMQRAARLVTETVGDQANEHVSLVLLSLAALALFVLMLRT